MPVPFVDLRAQYRTLKSGIDRAIQAVIDDTAFIGGKDNPYVRQFETQFAHWLGVDDAIGCANGTDAIEILLLAAGIGPGDEVIVPALTWISTGEAVNTVGATPIFADVDPVSFTICPQSVERVMSAKTKAIIPVHLYGQPADMASLLGIAERHNVLILEDCAQAHGARYNGKLVGTMGHMASFSFYPGKNLGAYGDAGAMVARDPEIARRARMIANHGQSQKHHHHFVGRNSRLDGIQAAVLSEKLPHLDNWNTRRVAAAAKLSAEISEKCPDLTTPSTTTDRYHVYHLYVIKSSDRNALAEHMRNHGIANAVHYPIPLPLMPAYASHGHKREDFPSAAALCGEILSLPMFPELEDSQIAEIVDALASFNTQNASQ